MMEPLEARQRRSDADAVGGSVSPTGGLDTRDSAVHQLDGQGARLDVPHVSRVSAVACAEEFDAVGVADDSADLSLRVAEGDPSHATVDDDARGRD